MVEQELREFIQALYASLGDRQGFDQHLHPEVLMWESDAPELLRGLADLDDLRDLRSERHTGPAPLWVRPEILAVQHWGKVGVIRYELRAHYGSARTDDVFRVTDVVEKADRWRIVHHHAQKMEPAGPSAPN